MDTHQEIEKLKKQVLRLEAEARLHGIQAAVIYSLMRAALYGATGRESSALKLDQTYRDTLWAEARKFLATLSDDQPALAAELHTLLQQFLQE